VLRVDRRLLQNIDGVLLGLVAFLLAIGFANLFSATHADAADGISPLVRRQLAALVVAGVAFLATVMLDYRRFERLAIPIYFATLALLGVTLLVAPVTRGSQSWLVFGSLRFQPSEVAKLALVLMLARHFHHAPPGEIRRLRQLWRPALIAAAPVGLIVLQRDMGVAVLTLLVAVTYLPLARIPWRAWLGVAAAGVVALALVWQFALEPYQRGRILDFLDPGRDPLDSGYQALQSTIAVGSGGLLGKGWLEGTQTHLRFLPTQHTDFVFSVLAEEWGFAGATLVLVTYLTLLLWGLVIARRSKESFGAMLAIGLVGCLFWPAAINVAMVLGLAPVIGLPLPFFSYGGSALVAALVAVGLLLNISMRRFVF
jgi:rod shape determining protein RodA